MTTLILIFLILIASLIGAYTMNFQETTLSIGRKLAPNNELLPAGLQDAITSKGQTLRNIIYPFLTLVIFVYGLIFYNWYFALGFTVLTFFIITPILKFVLPKIESDYYKQKIKNNLLKRQSHYRSIGDTDSEMAIKEVLTRFNKLD